MNPRAFISTKAYIANTAYSTADKLTPTTATLSLLLRSNPFEYQYSMEHPILEIVLYLKDLIPVPGQQFYSFR